MNLFFDAVRIILINFIGTRLIWYFNFIILKNRPFRYGYLVRPILNDPAFQNQNQAIVRLEFQTVIPFNIYFCVNRFKIFSN